MADSKENYHWDLGSERANDKLGSIALCVPGYRLL